MTCQKLSGSASVGRIITCQFLLKYNVVFAVVIIIDIGQDVMEVYMAHIWYYCQQLSASIFKPALDAINSLNHPAIGANILPCNPSSFFTNKK